MNPIDNALIPELWLIVASYTTPEELTIFGELKLKLTQNFKPPNAIYIKDVILGKQLNVLRWIWQQPLAICSVIQGSLWVSGWRQPLDLGDTDLLMHLVLHTKDSDMVIWLIESHPNVLRGRWETFINRMSLDVLRTVKALYPQFAELWTRDIGRTLALNILNADPVKAQWLIDGGMKIIGHVKTKDDNRRARIKRSNDRWNKT